MLLTAGGDAGAIEVSIDGGAYVRKVFRAYYGPNYPYTHILAEGLSDR